MHNQKAIVILWILVVAIFENGNTDDPKDKSICTRYHRITATKQVSYEEQYDEYYSDMRIRTNYRTEVNVNQHRIIYWGYFTKWEPTEMCCEGYEPYEKAEEAETCVPVCLSGCPHGNCVKPNQCECGPGYRNVTNNLTKYSDCEPECSSGCHGGRCIEPNTCDCDWGYVSAKNQSSCKPICAIYGFGPQGCGHNASCVAPHTCQCDHGYIATLNSSANPDLNFTSIIVWETNDQPKIGKRTTFNASDVICMPSCRPECEADSDCVAPNKCECKTGYGRALTPEQEENGSSCVPTCKQTCFNGFCAAPDRCACREGYKPHLLLNEDLCEPICHEKCVNGKCTQPGVCECSDGYEKLTLGTEPDEKSTSICTPICPGRCPNGTCVSPGNCHCNVGYLLDFRRISETGTDIADTTMSAVSQLDYSVQQFCRPGCDPHCPTGWTCAAPNRCQTGSKLSDPHFHTFATIRIVNSTADCGDVGVLHEENEACGCEYHVDGKKYIEPGLCAIIFTDEEAFFNMNRVMVWDYNYTVSFDTTDLIFRREECRTLIHPRKILDAVREKPKNCYLLSMLPFGPSTGDLDIDRKLSPISLGRGNETIICLSTAAETMCGSVESKVVNGQNGQVVGIVFGTITLVALIAGAIYLARWKTRKIRVPGATSKSNVNIMEQSETMDSPLHTLDGPHA